MDYALAVDAGTVADSTLFYFHRQAGDEHDLTTKEGARAAVIEASGPAAVWRDIDAIVSLWADPSADRSWWERVWCNRLVKGGSQAFDVTAWQKLAQPDNPVKPGDQITIGFDGAMFHDSTAIVATHIESGYQWLAGLWECPHGVTNWQVPAEEVDAVMRALFADFTVWRLYADPPYWQAWIAVWAGAFGQERVIEWFTNSRKRMTAALEGFETAIREGSIRHADDKRLERHIGNARRKNIPGQLDERGQPFWLIQKERSDSPHKIDAAMAAVLSWEARTDAIAAGVLKVEEPQFQVFFVGGRR